MTHPRRNSSRLPDSPAQLFISSQRKIHPAAHLAFAGCASKPRAIIALARIIARHQPFRHADERACINSAKGVVAVGPLCTLTLPPRLCTRRASSGVYSSASLHSDPRGSRLYSFLSPSHSLSLALFRFLIWLSLLSRARDPSCASPSGSFSCTGAMLLCV